MTTHAWSSAEQRGVAADLWLKELRIVVMSAYLAPRFDRKTIEATFDGVGQFIEQGNELHMIIMEGDSSTCRRTPAAGGL